MDMIQITSVEKQEKGRVRIGFDNGIYISLYKGEIQKLPFSSEQDLLTEGAYITQELYQKLLKEIVGVRAKKRAVYLLELMDRTKKQLADKLEQNGYPSECVREAIAYVRRYHYQDDLRYAEHYIRCNQDKKSRQRLKADLMAKGVDREIIDAAFEEEYEADETVQIRKLLEKRHYDYENTDRKEMQRTYRFLLRRGFCGNDILRVMQADNAI